MQKSNTPVCEIDYKTHLAEIQPYDSGTPKINTPAFYGASPGKDFLYLIPTVGERPLYFSISGLPDGLELNAADGIIHGKSAVSVCIDFVRLPAALFLQCIRNTDSRSVTQIVQRIG